MQNTKQLSHTDNSGVIPYNTTNDYMFRYILQENETVLRGLICALLRLKPEEIVREQCRAREDALRRERTLERDNKRLLAENALLRKQLAELQAQSSKN